MVDKYTMNILQSYGCEGEGCGAFVEPEVDVDGGWIRDIDYTPLESSHAELLGALKFIKDMLAFYEGSEQKLEGVENLVAVINAQGSDGDFQMMLSEARQALKSAEEVK